ncbi:hypothetical protein ICN84_06900 [Akkermansia glycaniphila]|uniref:hypothetical protein n=1 Tax=Akkermansia glycaniphila TaxID=1679444 RepID=UPI001C014635|nr:hypothetical protein [Akkermansia glycaniphila]MBT9449803.1 hypothetical protein [Akkermansia glycaniphila]
MSTSNQQEHDTSSDKEIKSGHIWASGIIVGLIAIVTCVCFPSILWEWGTPHKAEDTNFGTFGDQYGALNTLFSGLAFTGLIVTILLQRQDLKQQCIEMREARAEAAKQTKEAKAQTALMAQQLQTQQEEMRGARAEAEKQTKEAEAQTALMAEQTLSACMFSYLETMQKHKASIHIRPKHPTSVESSTIPEKEGDDAINFIYDQLDSLIENLAGLNNLVETAIRKNHTIDSCNKYLENIAHIQESLYSLQFTMGYFSLWVTPFKLWNKRVYHSQMTDERKREYIDFMFESLTMAERFSLLVYSIMARTSLYRNGSDTPSDPSVLGEFFLDNASIRDIEVTAYYEGGMALLYHLLKRRIYGREVLVRRITEFYENQLENILREAPVSAEDTPS